MKVKAGEWKMKVGDLVKYNSEITVLCSADPDAIGVVVSTYEVDEAFNMVFQRCLVRWTSGFEMGDSFYYYDHQLDKVSQ